MAYAGVDHVVAVDGAYALYPQARGASPAEQADVIAGTARGLGMGVTIHVPQHPWTGNECAKRSAMFELAGLVAEPGKDWLLVIDADEVIDTAGTFRQALTETVEDVAEVLLVEDEGASPARRLFRAQVGGIRVLGTHSTYLDAIGRCLWGPVGPLEPAAQLHDFRIRHRPHARTQERAARQRSYYEVRDSVGAESSHVVAA